MTDAGQALLRDYAASGSESAFRDLVARYLDLVYSTALRQVGGDTHLAQDVTQTVFLHLARKARRIPANVMLGGWLHQATLNVAATVNRTERRRQSREKEAAQMNALHQHSADNLEHIAPILDEAISQLPGEDRTAVVLRFFEKRDFRSVGEALGSSEDAARMRVNRALEKLQSLLKQRGVTISTAALGTALAAEAVTAAPVGLSASIASTALAGAVAGGVTLSFLSIMTTTNLKVAAVSALVIGGLGTSLVLQHQSLVRLRQDNQSLQQRIEALRNAKEQPEAKTTGDQEALEKLRRQESELLRLRSEVTALHKAVQPAASRSTPADQAKTTAPEKTSPVMKLQVSVRTQIPGGQTLITGGWVSASGKRIFLLATPRIEGQNADQVHIKTKVIEVPESVLARLGLDALKADGTESSAQQVFPAEQTDRLLKELGNTQGAESLAESSITTFDGRQAEVQVVDQKVVEGVNQELGPVINLIPAISSDKTAIDLTLQAHINRLTSKP